MKKRNFTLLTLSFVLSASILLVINSCNKNDKVVFSDDSVKQTSSSYEYYENDLNPWDYYGAFHNQGMNYVFNGLGSYVPNFDSTLFLKNRISTFCASTFSLTTTEISNALSLLESELEFAMNENDDDFQLAFESIIDNNDSLTSSVKTYIHSINDLVFGSTQDVLTIVDQIKSVESIVLSDTNLSLKDSKIILTYTSVYRHSLHYWDNYAGNEWVDYVPLGIFKRIRQWIKNNYEKVTLADVIGLIPILMFDDNTGLWVTGGIAASVFVGVN